jgi:SAM-dependent methyltransferase
MPNYDAVFFDYVNSGAVISAERLIPLLLRETTIRTVLDVGCGTGAWLSVWGKMGVDVLGIDGEYVDKSRLMIPADRFLPLDLALSFDLRRRFDLVQSLEVAEHLPENRAADFVASLVRHSDLVLFSAAVKGQGGDHHINEQSYDYWRKRFALHEYVVVDYLRPLMTRLREIEPWYRYNTLLYASPARFNQLPASMRCAQISTDRSIRDVSPPLYRARKMLTRLLPVPIATGVAKLKERMVTSIRDNTA